MGIKDGKFTQGTMKSVSGKVDSGSAMGDKGIPGGIPSGGAVDATKKVESPGTWDQSAKMVPPKNVSPKGPPIAD